LSETEFDAIAELMDGLCRWAAANHGAQFSFGGRSYSVVHVIELPLNQKGTDSDGLPLYVGSDDDEILVGTDDAESIEGSGGRDILCGGPGGDRLHGWQGGKSDGNEIDGKPTLDPETGLDLDVNRNGEVDLDGGDILVGQAGVDEMQGNHGSDLLIGDLDDIADARGSPMWGHHGRQDDGRVDHCKPASPLNQNCDPFT
jgi:Ca2+-binding RTX toxin-like protein